MSRFSVHRSLQTATERRTFFRSSFDFRAYFLPNKNIQFAARTHNNNDKRPARLGVHLVCACDEIGDAFTLLRPKCWAVRACSGMPVAPKLFGPSEVQSFTFQWLIRRMATCRSHEWLTFALLTSKGKRSRVRQNKAHGLSSFRAHEKYSSFCLLFCSFLFSFSCDSPNPLCQIVFQPTNAFAGRWIEKLCAQLYSYLCWSSTQNSIVVVIACISMLPHKYRRDMNSRFDDWIRCVATQLSRGKSFYVHIAHVHGVSKMHECWQK